MNYRGGYGDSVEEAASLFSTRMNPWQVNANAEAAGAAAGQGAIIFQGFLGGRGYGGNMMQQPTSTARWDLNPVHQLVEENHASGNQLRDHDNQDPQQQAKWNHVNPSATRLRDDDELLGFSVDQRSAQQTDAQKSTTCTVIYKECQKNQALDTAAHSVDGCGEFMRRGKEGQEALQCMACGCHRSYHRSVRVGDNGKEMEFPEELHVSLSRIETVALNLMEATGRALPLLAAAGAGAGAAGGDDHLAQKELETVMKISIENLDHISKVTLSTVECIGILQQTAGTATANSSRLSSEVSPVSIRKTSVGARAPGNVAGVKPKRKRTQFSDEQRGKMQAYAEHAGWTIVGQRKENIATACKDIGVTPKTLKYWIHNAKQKLKRSNELPV